jgi:hypothetical protein
VAALLVLMGAMAGFFFIFRIVHPVAQRLPTTPQHVISLDPNDPAALALIHRAQDRSFALLSDSDSSRAVGKPLLAFHPSFEGYEIKLRALSLSRCELRQPRLFTATSDVLPPVPRRATEPSPRRLRHAEGRHESCAGQTGACERGICGIKLTQPTRVQFRVAVGSAGRSSPRCRWAVRRGRGDEQLGDAVTALRFAAG